MKEKRIVISKDTDFYYSHLLHGKPHKLDRKNLAALFARHLDEVLGLLQENTLVKLDRSAAKAVR